MSDNPISSIRIVDVARMAGVSTATVDRVIHNRGKVSEDNLRKIREVLDRVDYHPNLAARSLASGRERVIGVVIPSFREGEYWADVDAGVDRAAVEVGRFHLSVHKFFFDQYNLLSFERALAALRREEFHAVVIATLFAERVVGFARELDAEGIPYIFVDSDIAGCNQLAYFGTSSQDAGAVAARLLTDRMGLSSDIVIGSTVHRGNGSSNQCLGREQGFRTYLQQAGFSGRLHVAVLHIDDDRHNTKVLRALFEQYPAIRGAVTFNSTCYILARYLHAARRPEVRLVGYDIIHRNEEMLCEGVVTALIGQRPEAQGFQGVMAIYEQLIGGRRIARVNNMPIDILFRENIQFYKNNII